MCMSQIYNIRDVKLNYLWNLSQQLDLNLYILSLFLFFLQQMKKQLDSWAGLEIKFQFSYKFYLSTHYST